MKLDRSLRSALSAAAAVLAFAAGCSTPDDTKTESPAPEPSLPSLPAGTPGPTTPSLEPSGPEAPRPTGDGGVAISLPQLPIGGNSIPDGAGRQCASASWLPDVFPPEGVTVTGIRIDHPDGFRVGGSCGGAPSCASFTFRPGAGGCSIAVTGTGTAGASLLLAGRATCAPGRESSCREFRSAVNPGLVPLIQPDEPDEPAPPSTETTTSPAG
jgi:hypothetical protein